MKRKKLVQPQIDLPNRLHEMRLPQAEVIRFQVLYKKHYGTEISYEEAERAGVNLVCLLKSIMNVKQP